MKSVTRLLYIVISLFYISLLLTACGVESKGGSTPQSGNSNTAILSWDPPTNMDGTPVDNLRGYKIYYGTTSGEYTKPIDVNDPNTHNYTIDNLPQGKYYFVITAYDIRGNESDYSNEESKIID